MIIVSFFAIQKLHYFLTSNQRLYNHDITHSMTLSLTHFHDAAWVMIFVTLHVQVPLSVTLFHDAS